MQSVRPKRRVNAIMVFVLSDACSSLYGDNFSVPAKVQHSSDGTTPLDVCRIFNFVSVSSCQSQFCGILTAGSGSSRPSSLPSTFQFSFISSSSISLHSGGGCGRRAGGRQSTPIKDRTLPISSECSLLSVAGYRPRALSGERRSSSSPPPPPSTTDERFESELHYRRSRVSRRRRPPYCFRVVVRDRFVVSGGGVVI